MIMAVNNVLLLEDETADAHLIRMALETGKTPVNLYHVVDGREGLEFLRKMGDYAFVSRPDLILLDLNMPRMNGYEFLKSVKSNPMFKDIPVVVFTASDMHRDIVSSYEAGASGYITKPHDLYKFFTAISQLDDYCF